MQMFKVKGQSVQKIELRQTDIRTGRRTEAIALPPMRAQSAITQRRIECLNLGPIKSNYMVELHRKKLVTVYLHVMLH